MGADYKFYCNACKKTGGGFSSQAWGTGNADIIDSFRFLMKHHAYCREGFMVVGFDEYIDLEEDVSEELLGYFPHSCEWKEEISNKECQIYEKYIQDRKAKAQTCGMKNESE